jgi:hypothetical protein
MLLLCGDGVIGFPNPNDVRIFSDYRIWNASIIKQYADITQFDKYNANRHKLRK